MLSFFVLSWNKCFNADKKWYMVRYIPLHPEMTWYITKKSLRTNACKCLDYALKKIFNAPFNMSWAMTWSNISNQKEWYSCATNTHVKCLFSWSEAISFLFWWSPLFLFIDSWHLGFGESHCGIRMMAQCLLPQFILSFAPSILWQSLSLFIT